jgi:DNA repair protein RadC
MPYPRFGEPELATMSSSNTPKTSSDIRYERYKVIIEFTVGRLSFRIHDVHKACVNDDMRIGPAFVTRVVNELAQEGWIVREAGDTPKRADELYRWNNERGEFPTRWLDDKIFGKQVKQAPEQQRPREKLLANNAAGLTTAELLAILIRSGRPGESAVMGGEKLARAFHDRLRDLPNAGRAELKSISAAIEKTAYCQILAGIELGRRVALEITDAQPEKITGSKDAVAWCRKTFARLATDSRQEEFHIVTLDQKNQVIKTHRITVGTLDASLVHPREVFRPAIRDAAASVILVHNHPSGDATPSAEDLAVTRRLESSGELLGIDVLDHIVVGSRNCTSIREHRT